MYVWKIYSYFLYFLHTLISDTGHQDIMLFELIDVIFLHK